MANTEKQVEYALGSLAVEKLYPSETAVELCEKLAGGKLKTEDAISAVLRQHGVSRGKTNARVQ